jgi:hypothetical protein
MPTSHEVFREMLKSVEPLKAFAGDRIYWYQIPPSVITANKGALAYWLQEGQRATLTSCGGFSMQTAKFAIYAWAMDGCAVQVAAEAMGDLLGYQGTHLGVAVRVSATQRIEDRIDGDAYGCGISIEVHFRAA